MKKVIFPLLGCLLALALAGCGGADTSSAPPVPSSFSAPAPSSEAISAEAGSEESKPSADYSEEPVIGLWKASSAIVEGTELSLSQLGEPESGSPEPESYSLELRADGGCTLSYVQNDTEFSGDGTWKPTGSTEDDEPLYTADIAGTRFDFAYDALDDNLHLLTTYGSLVMRQ